MDNIESWKCPKGEILCYYNKYQSSHCIKYDEDVCDGYDNCLDPAKKPKSMEQVKTSHRNYYYDDYNDYESGYDDGHHGQRSKYIDERYCDHKANQVIRLYILNSCGHDM